MTDAVQLERLLAAIRPIVDRHAETKAGSQLLDVPLLPREMKELRSAFEPFREQCSVARARQEAASRASHYS